MGISQWTVRAESHLEIGFACDDPTLVEATAFVADVIAFSNHVDTTCAVPNRTSCRWVRLTPRWLSDGGDEPDDDGEDW